MQLCINSKGFGVVYVFVALAFCQRWPVRLNLIDTNGSGAGWAGGVGDGEKEPAQNITWLHEHWRLGDSLPGLTFFPQLAPE